MKTIVSVLRWFIAFRFLTGNPYSKIKNLVPLAESQEKKLFLKAYKKGLSDTILRAIGVSIAQFKVVEVRKRVRNENCHQDTIRRNIKPKFPQKTTFGTLLMEIAKKTLSSVSVCMKTAEMCFSKTCINFGRCFGDQRWAQAVEK